MVDVHALGRCRVVFEEGVLGFRAVLADGPGGGADVAGTGVVLVTGPAHLTLGSGVGDVAEDSAVETLGFLRSLEKNTKKNSHSVSIP